MFGHHIFVILQIKEFFIYSYYLVVIRLKNCYFFGFKKSENSSKIIECFPNLYMIK